MNPKSLMYEEQLELFEKRGMSIRETDIKKIENISYYRLKEFARPLAKTTKKSGDIIIDYTGVSFSEVLTRYYQDKNLRIFLLHAIEKIEVSVKTNLAYILGDKYGAFGYLDFSRWGNRQEFSRYQMQQKEMRFKRQLLKSVRKLPSFSDAKMKRNQDADGFPTVWLSLNVLTFGEMVSLIEVLSKKNIIDLASKYDCTANEFLSWMKTLHFVRNICSHNSNIIDIAIKTEPLYREEWNDFLFTFDNQQGKKPTNRLAVILAILKHFISIINPKYKWKNIIGSLHSLSDSSDKKSQLLGFKDFDGLKKFKSYKKLK
jgi:abortive infection bacteriophage resistance protein